MTVSDLPALNACLNGTATLLLTAGFIFIKSGRVAAAPKRAWFFGISRFVRVSRHLRAAQNSCMASTRRLGPTE